MTSRTREKLVLFLSLFVPVLIFVLLIFMGHVMYHLPDFFDIGYEILPKLGFDFLNQAGLFVSLILVLITTFYRAPGEKFNLKRIAFISFAFSLWFFIRILFPPSTALPIPPESSESTFPQIIKSIWEFIKVGLDSPRMLFFSGHTGLPFLGFLVFSNIDAVLDAILKSRKGIVINWKDTVKSYFLKGALVPVKILLVPLSFLSLEYFLLKPDLPWLLAIIVAWIIIITFRKNKFPMACLFLPWSILMAFTVIVVHSHYTIDVFGAYGITLGIYAVLLLPFEFGWWWFVTKRIKN